MFAEGKLPSFAKRNVGLGGENLRGKGDVSEANFPLPPWVVTPESGRTGNLSFSYCRLSELKPRKFRFILATQLQKGNIEKGTCNRKCLFHGAPEGIRTPDLLVRSQLLYPAELPAHIAV